MRIRTDYATCDYCGKDLNERAYEDTHTKEEQDFCSYECMEDFYGYDIPSGEDFICIAY